MHALTLLKTDHRKVEKLFKDFEKTESKQRKGAIAKQIVAELAIHAAIEEQVFYPAVRQAIGDEQKEMILEALEEHHVVKWELWEIEKMNPDDERFEAKVKVLKDTVMHHVEEEESLIFKAARESISTKQFNDLGTALEAAKRVAPKRPHPRAPDQPPGNLIVGIGAGMIDRARSAMRNLTKTATTRRPAKTTARRGAAGGRKAAATRRTTTTRRRAKQQ